MSGAAFDVVVIGGGANGLVAATRLGKAGLRVLLLEGGESLGGQGRVVEFAPGFRAAPLGTDPGWLPPSIARGLGLEGLERGVRRSRGHRDHRIGRGTHPPVRREEGRGGDTTPLGG